MSNNPSGSGTTRREALRKILLISAATGLTLLGASEITGSISKAKTQGSPKATQTETTVTQKIVDSTETTAPLSEATSSDTSGLLGAISDYTIKVVYFGFQTVQTTGTTEEYLTLQAPVFLQDVLSRIKQEHVVLAAMLPIMAITINGIPADGNPQLANNSEVDLIPLYAGG